MGGGAYPDPQHGSHQGSEESLLEQHLLAGCGRLCPFQTCFPVSRGQIKTLEARGGEKGNQELFVPLSSPHACRWNFLWGSLSLSLCRGCCCPCSISCLSLGMRRGPGGIVELEGALQYQGSHGFSTFRHPLLKQCSSSLLPMEFHELLKIPFSLASPSLGSSNLFCRLLTQNAGAPIPMEQLWSWEKLILSFSCLDRKCTAPRTLLSAHLWHLACAPHRVPTDPYLCHHLGRASKTWSSLGRSSWCLSTIPIINVSLMLSPSTTVINTRI